MKKILLIEYDPDTRKVVKEILKPEGIEVEGVKEGKDSLKKLSKKYDLVLLEIMLPGMTPHQIIKKINGSSKNKNTKISYFSMVEFSPKEKRKLLQEKNVVGYIQKPFTDSSLIKQVKKLLNK